MLESETILRTPYFELWMLLELCYVMSFALVFSAVVNYFLFTLDQKRTSDYNGQEDEKDEKR
tara:strand:- start:80 stop:265 length:186 start_codon:yes stop_codon:yes gene_type:complete